MVKVEDLIKQKKIVEQEQKKLNKAVKTEQELLRNKLQKISKSIKENENLVLTQENVDELIKKSLHNFKQKEVKPISKFSKNNRYLLLIFGITTLLYLNRNNTSTMEYRSKMNRFYEETKRKLSKKIIS